MHFGQSESVVLGQPSVGFVFCHDFRSGLSDHAGVNVAVRSDPIQALENLPGSIRGHGQRFFEVLDGSMHSILHLE